MKRIAIALSVLALLASALLVLPAQSGELTARLDETLGRLEQSHGADTWDLAHDLRQVAGTDSAQSAPYLIAATRGGNGILYAPARTYSREISLKPEEWKKVRRIRSTLGFRADKLTRE